jgi:hypothetical protein
MTCTGGSPGANWFRKGFPKGKLEVGLENNLYRREFAEGACKRDWELAV